jgi:hypothetical protein
MIRFLIAALFVLAMAGTSWAAGATPGSPVMRVWLNQPGQLMASFPDYPVPTDWVKVVRDAKAQADAMGYVVLWHLPVEYTEYLGVNPVTKTYTGTIPIRFISLSVRPKAGAVPK